MTTGGLLLLPAIFCAVSAAEITPAPRESGCHLMPEKCPAGWVEKAPGRSAGEAWVECCPQAGPFPELPPQKPALIPVCPGGGFDPNVGIGFGIEGEGGCDLADPNCPIKAPPYGDELPAQASGQPRKIFPLADAPQAQPRKTLPRTRLVKGGGKDVGEAGAADPAASLKRGSAEERASAAMALARAGRAMASAAADLERMLKDDSSPKVRACAALALTAVSPERAVAPLQRALSDPHVGVRHIAAKALSRIGTPEARRALRDHKRSQP